MCDVITTHNLTFKQSASGNSGFLSTYLIITSKTMSRVPDVEVNRATDGDRPISITRRVERERERLIGMTDEERAWRKKWLQAQELAPEEPVMPKNYYKEMYNPIRRFYKWPMNKFENMLEPIAGKELAFYARHLISKSAMGICGIYLMWYHLKYHKMDWTRKGGWKVTISRSRMLPDEKNLDAIYKVKGNQFYVNNFDKSPI